MEGLIDWDNLEGEVHGVGWSEWERWSSRFGSDSGVSEEKGLNEGCIDDFEDGDSGLGSGDESGKGFLFHGKYMFVTYSKSKIDDQEEFYGKLKAKMPRGTEIFGGKEFHEDGTPHYHVVMKFPERQHWTNARKHLMLEGDTSAIKIRTKARGQSTGSFLEGTQAYCAKDGNPNVFGERIKEVVGRTLSLKRQFGDIDRIEDFEEAKQAFREADPYRFMISYPSVMSYLNGEKVKGDDGMRKRRKIWSRPWVVPKAMEKWKEENIDNKPNGRPKALILVGNPLTGKMEWAKSFGEPIVMTQRWNLKAYREDATHIVVNDVQATSFGPMGEAYWRMVLGCHEEFDATDRYTQTRNLKWGFPCVWTCNYDLDPRRIEKVRDYIERVGAVVVEVNKPLFG